MTVEHARSGDLLAVEPTDACRGVTGAVALVHDERLEVMRWVLPANREVPEHLAYGPLTVACLHGDVLLCLHDRERRMPAGSIAYLAAGERHALRALADSVLLVTMVLRPDAGSGGSAGGTDGRAPTPHGARSRTWVDGK